jgi:hypothetical protein
MSNETDNLVLEHLRAIRKEVTDLRANMDRRFDEVDRRFAIVSQRLDHMEKRMEASQYVLTATLGSLLSDNEDVKARLAALENA